MNYKTQGVCSRAIHFDVVDNKVTNVAFEGLSLIHSSEPTRH